MLLEYISFILNKNTAAANLQIQKMVVKQNLQVQKSVVKKQKTYNHKNLW